MLSAWAQVWRWPWEPQVAVAVVALGWLYAVGLSRTVGTVTPRLRLRVMSFYLSLAALVIALQSPIDTFSDRSFAWHMVQHMLLLLVVPPLALASAPLSVLRAGLPSRRLRHAHLPIRRRWEEMCDRLPFLRLLGHPRTAVAAFTAYLWATHLPAVFDLTLRQPFVHDSEHLGYLAVGLWYWSRLIESPPLPALPSYRWRIELIAGGVLACWALGVVLTLARTPVYTAYLDVPGATPQGALSSLQDGGGIMWAPSMLPWNILIVVMIRQALASSLRRDALEQGSTPKGAL